VTYRFTSKADINGAVITCSNIFAAIGCIGTAANTIAPVASSFIIRSIKIWTSPQDSIPATTAIQWSAVASNFNKDEVRDDTLPASAGVTRSLIARPPKQALASFWNDDGATVAIFSIYCPKGSIVDLRVSFTLPNTFTATSLSYTGAVAGTFYYAYLDGHSGNLATTGRATALP
jgi:hypothetical protein